MILINFGTIVSTYLMMNFKIIIDDINDHLIMPIDCLLKFDMAVISCRLATEKKL